ncbi:Lipid droplet-associated serine hydrolase [Entamoeba marina]
MSNSDFLKATNICGQTCLMSHDLFTSSHCVLLLSGNPSLLKFYIPFCAKLKKILPHTSFLVVSLHSTPLSNIHPIWNITLKEAVKVKVHLVNYLLKNVPKETTFTLMTHSLGSYIGLHLLSQSPEFSKRITNIIHLFPAIRDLKHLIDLFTRIISKIPLFYPFISLVTYFLKFLPLFIFTFFIQYVSTTPPELSALMQSELNPHHLTQVAYLTLDEEDTITTHDKPTVETLNKTSPITTVVFGINDKYTPEWIRQEFRENYKNISVYETDIKHAFVLGKAEAMADYLEYLGVLKE